LRGAFRFSYPVEKNC